MDKMLSIYKDEKSFPLFMEAYEKAMTYWNFPYETLEISTDYGNCHVIASGPKDGKPVLLFHGMTGNSSMWYATIRGLQSYRTYCVDAPGDFGKSTVKQQIKTSEDAIHWMDQILSALQLESASFIGHSMGGWFCSNLSQRNMESITYPGIIFSRQRRTDLFC